MGNLTPNRQRQSTSAAAFDHKCRLLAGRVGIVAAVFVFIALYMYGIAEYGVFLGIALGWLPCGITAWLTAIVVSTIGRHVAHRFLRPALLLSGVPLVKPGVQNK